MQINWIKVLRDVAIIFALTFIGGFAVGFASAIASNAIDPTYLSLSNVIFGTIGFGISYVLTKVGRVQHLLAVAAGTWLLSAVNLLFGFGNITTWMLAIIPILLMTGLGSLIGWGWEAGFSSGSSRPSHGHHHG